MTFLDKGGYNINPENSLKLNRSNFDMTFSHTNKMTKTYLSVLLFSVLSGCASNSAISTHVKAFEAPKSWAAESVLINVDNQVMNDWLGIAKDKHLQQVIDLALANNFNLKAAAYEVELATERLAVSKSTDFPELSMALTQQRSKTVNGDSENYNNNAELSLNLSYELDLWGKLSDEQQQAELSLAAVKSSYENQRINLITDVVKAWFNLLESETLLSLYQERAQNLKTTLRSSMVRIA